MSDDHVAIHTNRLTVVRGRVRALDGVDISVETGSITGLLGPSGCGKTTVMRAIVGAQEITAGEVRVFGMPAGDRSLRSRIGYVTQSASVYGELTVEENVHYFAALHANPEPIDDVLATVGLGELRRRRTAELSGGQRSRVSIACALVGRPTLLVLDEPTVGLDPLLRVELWRRFRDLADAGTTLLVSSHVMDEAAHCDSLILMRAGRVLVHTTPDELRTRTGRDDLEDAFIALIERETAA